jgi:hypothetical protein
VSSGVAGLAFFGTREYLVSPVLVGLGATKGHVRRARGDADAAISSVRTERVLDSGIAGALAGGGLSFGLREC